jgi:hypothetical protein
LFPITGVFFLLVTGGNWIASNHGSWPGSRVRVVAAWWQGSGEGKKWWLGFRRQKEKKRTKLKHELLATIERTSTQTQQSKLLNEGARLKRVAGTRI